MNYPELGACHHAFRSALEHGDAALARECHHYLETHRVQPILLMCRTDTPMPTQWASTLHLNFDTMILPKICQMPVSQCLCRVLRAHLIAQSLFISTFMGGPRKTRQVATWARTIKPSKGFGIVASVPELLCIRVRIPITGPA